MICQASVNQVRKQLLSRQDTRIVIAMCYYPRGIKKEWRDDFVSDLAPDRKLFQDWKSFERISGHEAAFELSKYESRFELSPFAFFHLKKYSELSKNKDIFLVCQCEVGERCHREMLMLFAQKKFGATINKLFHSYPIFEARIPDFQTDQQFVSK